MSTLDRLAEAHGIPKTYRDAHDTLREVPQGTRAAILAAMGIDPAAPDAPCGAPPDRALAAPEERCFLPPDLQNAPGWGLFCQLYELRSARNWGIGDFADLAALAGIAGRRGADFLGVNPLHALFLAAPERCSPFAPSHRSFLNPLYIAVDEVPGHAAPAPEGLAAARAGDRVDYPAVAALKLAALRAAFDRRPFADAGAQRDHDDWVAGRGAGLRRHALFEAISARMVALGHGAGWMSWPEEWRDPDGARARALAEDAPRDIAFYQWLQWVADRQLAHAQAVALGAGMRVGLYLDLAVGEAPDGSAGWGGAHMLRGLRIGAPPDLFQSEGQDWGLAAPSPAALEAQDFAPFRDMIRAQLDHAGALRIDHAMALWQLFLIPDGKRAPDGGYLRYPARALLRVLAEESHRARALIVGEDLGSVPDGFREVMARARILSYRLLYFEQDAGGFLPPQAYPAEALACLSTHDLPTLADWWQARDIALRLEHGLVDAATTRQHERDRVRERGDLLRALREAGLIGDGPRDTDPQLPPGVALAAHLFAGCAPSVLVAVRLADLAGPQAPTNLPGTSEQYPNWQLRSPTPLEALETLPGFGELAQRLSDLRPRGRGGRPPPAQIG